MAAGWPTLQCCTDSPGHLSDSFSGQECLDSTSLVAKHSRGSSSKAGLMPYGNCSPTDRCGHSGTTSSDGGRLTRACGLITCCFRRRYAHGSCMPESSAGYEEKKTPAITPRRGSRYVRNLLERDLTGQSVLIFWVGRVSWFRRGS